MHPSKTARQLLVGLLTSSLALSATPLAAQQSQTGGPPPGHLEAPPNDKPVLYEQHEGKPFIDVDEWRTTPRPHRYIHGGFENSHLRFSLYLPPKELYKNRFLLMLEGGTGGADKMLTAPGWDWAFDVAFDDMGAYLVETNEGHWPDEGLGTVTPHDVWQASGYGTSYVRNIAEQLYGTRPTHGYVTGCSGGGLRSSEHAIELPDLIDGSVSEAWGLFGVDLWSAYALAGAAVGDKMEDVKDAMEVGGSGDPYKGLTPFQAEAVHDWLGLGMNRDSVTQWKKEGWATAGPVMIYQIRDIDPTYFTDFWTKPGYMGHDDPKALEPFLFETTLEVDRTLTADEIRALTGGASIGMVGHDIATYGPSGSDNHSSSKEAALVKYDGPQEKLNFATVTILSGPDAGKDMILGMSGQGKNLLRPFTARAPYGFDNVKPGDKIKISNREYVAYMFYYRYHAQTSTRRAGLQDDKHSLAFPEFRVLMDANGKPKYPQRPDTPVLPPIALKGKIIALHGTADEAIWSPMMAGYETELRRDLGAANAQNQFRMWKVEDHPHCRGPLEGPLSTHLVPDTGATQQALRDLVKWVEDGVPPPADTSYTFAPDNKIVLASTAQARKGIQPLAWLTVGGGKHIEVPVGKPVVFKASAEVPPGTGYVVKAQFDFDGQGAWPETVQNISGTSTTLSATATHTYDKPGTYFAAFRVASHRDGAKGKGEPIYNLARVRVVVK